MNSESQHTESVKKILCADSYAKKGNGKKAKKESAKRTIQKQEIMILYSQAGLLLKKERVYLLHNAIAILNDILRRMKVDGYYLIRTFCVSLLR